MTERPELCDALAPSPIDTGMQLACFTRPHPEDPWHYDTRGLGVAFRIKDDGEVEALLGYTPEQAAARAANPEDEPPTSANLPALFARIDLDGHRVLDVDRLRELSPLVRTGLIASLRAAARQVRAARGTVVVPEDTYDLVRRTTAAGEVLRQWRDAFEAAAKEADAILEEEALTAVGGYPGYEEAPSGSLFVPDGEGQRIVVTPDWKPGESTWDVTTLANWLVDDEVKERVEDLTREGDAWDEAHAREVASNVVFRLLDLGRFTPGAKPIDALRRKLAGKGLDADAAVLRQVRSVGDRQYKGVKITREASK